MEKELLKKIEKAIDKALEDFLDRPDEFFDDEIERLKFKFGEPKALKNWKKKRTCIVDGCNKKSIEKSHTIQKSASIKLISENSHVLMPKLNTDIGEMEMISVGINEASTFPGYCSEHELLFQEFEQLKDFKSGEHLGLQLYRTTCREIVINEYQIESLTDLKNRYVEYRNVLLKKHILQNLGEEVLNIPDLKFNGFSLTNRDGRLKMVEERIKLMNQSLNDFLYPYRESVLSDLKKQKFQKIAYVAIDIDLQLPVTLAGRGNFYFKQSTTVRNIEVIINILPLKSKTYIFLSTLKKYHKHLQQFIEDYKNPLMLINLVESCMINGSDHWFITPSKWEKIKPSFQKEIIDVIWDEKFNIGHMISKTILNDEKDYYFTLAQNNPTLVDSHLSEFIEYEKKKRTIE